MEDLKEIQRRLEQALAQPADQAAIDNLAACGLDTLPVFRDYLKRDTDIGRAEAVEALLKRVLKERLSRPVSGADARRIARFQQELGFIFKYKSYAIKAAVPLGYSIFLQNPGEGFSFQRHVTHKTEVFHILEAPPGGYVFLCDAEDWDKHYDKETFDAWLAGESHPFFDRCRFVPQPGDVFVISRLNVVHTVIGCILEEYATVSTDMVDRLHDQNKGKPIPERFCRAYAEERLQSLRLPAKHRNVDMLSGETTVEPIPWTAVEGGERAILTDSFVTASNYRLSPMAAGALQRSAERAAQIRIFSGEGRIAIAGDDELDRLEQVAIPVKGGDLLFIPPGIHYRIFNDRGEALEYSEHLIAPNVAFI